MANASGLASEDLHPGASTQPRAGTTYKIAAHDQAAYLAAYPIGSSQPSWEAKLQYFLGSGHLGTTYLYSIDTYLFESPVAWFSKSASLEMKPGYEEANFPIRGIPMQSSCLRCHMSAVQPTDSGTLNRYSSAPFLHTGITCEACHGDSDRHVASSGKSPIVNPARLTAWERDSVCLSCHLEGDSTVARAGQSSLNYQPGQPISNYLSFYVKKDANATARAVSEVEQLAQSTCKRVSGDKMSCTSCHDPHLTPEPSQRIAFYRGKCLACHSEPQFKTHHAENPDCTSCHMPRNGSVNIQHVAWTDHRILRVPAASTPDTSRASSGELTPIFSPGATPRDLAMANYKTLLEGEPALAPAAWQQLSALRAQAGKDIDLLNAYGNMAAVRGQSTEAEKAFHDALAINPNDLTALSNLGVLLAKRGKLTESQATLQKAFDRNGEDAGLAMNLIRIDCINSDTTAARATLATALEFNPQLPRLRQLPAQLPNCGLTPSAH